MSLRIVLADDSLLVREGVRKVLDHQPGITVVGCCGDLDTLLATVDAEQPDVVVTDVRMPPTGTNEGVQAATRLRASHPRNRFGLGRSATGGSAVRLRGAR